MQKDAQKVIDRYSNRTKVTKLVVDEEDTTPTLQSYQEENTQISKEKNKQQAKSKIVDLKT